MGHEGHPFCQAININTLRVCVRVFAGPCPSFLAWHGSPFWRFARHESLSAPDTHHHFLPLTHTSGCIPDIWRAKSRRLEGLIFCVQEHEWRCQDTTLHGPLPTGLVSMLRRDVLRNRNCGGPFRSSGPDLPQSGQKTSAPDM